MMRAARSIDLPLPILEDIVRRAFDVAGGGMAARGQLSLVCKCGVEDTPRDVALGHSVCKQWPCMPETQPVRTFQARIDAEPL